MQDKIVWHKQNELSRKVGVDIAVLCCWREGQLKRRETHSCDGLGQIESSEEFECNYRENKVFKVIWPLILLLETNGHPSPSLTRTARNGRLRADKDFLSERAFLEEL
jgi:hypothetical protein